MLGGQNFLPLTLEAHMKKLLLALVLTAFSFSAMAAHHGGQGKHKHHAHKHHKHQKHQKSAMPAGQ